MSSETSVPSSASSGASASSKCNINVSFIGGPTGLGLAVFLEPSFIFGNVIFCFDLFHNGAMGLNLQGLQLGQLLFM